MIRRAGTTVAALAGGTLVFLGVYGHARPGDAVFGLIVAGGALALSRTLLGRGPPTGPGARVGAGVLARLAVETLWGVAWDSWRISRAALRATAPPEGVFVEVPLGGRGHTLLGALALMETLAPGSYLVDVDHRRGTALFHAFEAADAPDVRRRQRAGLSAPRRTRASGEEAL